MADQFNLFDSEDNMVLEDGSSVTDKFKACDLASFVTSKFNQWSRDRIETEKRWVKSYYNFRGFYGREVKFLDTEMSRVFVKITKTKVIAAYGQILDVLFGSGDVPLSIEPKRLPDLYEDDMHIDLTDAKDEEEDFSSPEVTFDSIGYEGDGNDLQAGETLVSRVGTYLARVFNGAKIQSGPPKDQQDMRVDPTRVIAKRMEKKIKDQLDMTSVAKHLRQSCLECVLLGTGVIKGPFVDIKEYPKWNEDGTYEPERKIVPKIERVTPFNIYTDRYATSAEEDAEGIIERHVLTKDKFVRLKRKPMFRRSAIDAAIEKGFNYSPQWWESDLKENDVGHTVERFEVLEYWGYAQVEDLLEFELDLPESLEEEDQVHVNVWVCNGEIIRLVLNPFVPVRIPYFIVPYEEDPYNFFGVGLPENMEDSQTLMNGFARMAVDNAVLSGSVILEVDEDNLVAGQSLDIYPGKIFRRTGGQTGQTIFPIKVPNIARENLEMFDRFRQFADEETGLPSYSHGQTGVSGMTRTASGMSMLFGAASLNVKTVIKNIDDYLLQPLGEAMYAFNNQFDFDKSLVADLEVRAKGTKSLMQKEVKTQRLLQFLQVVSNPFLSPFADYEYIIKEFGDSLELDTDKLVLDPKKRMLQAQLMAASNATAAGQQQQAEGAPSPEDATGGGGGNIGVGNPAMPDTEQFAGNAGGNIEQ